MTTMADRYRRWFDYEKDAHARVVESLRAVPDDADERYARAVGHLGHLAAARCLWLHRLGGTPHPPASLWTAGVTDDALFPRGVSLDHVTTALDKVHGWWDAWLETLDDATLARTFEYTSTEGDAYGNAIEDILTQLYGHSHHHRGQIAALVRELGGEPAAADFVFWSRKQG